MDKLRGGTRIRDKVSGAVGKIWILGPMSGDPRSGFVRVLWDWADKSTVVSINRVVRLTPLETLVEELAQDDY